MTTKRKKKKKRKKKRAKESKEQEQFDQVFDSIIELCEATDRDFIFSHCHWLIRLLCAQPLGFSVADKISTGELFELFKKKWFEEERALGGCKCCALYRYIPVGGHYCSQTVKGKSMGVPIEELQRGYYCDRFIPPSWDPSKENQHEEEGE